MVLALAFIQPPRPEAGTQKEPTAAPTESPDINKSEIAKIEPIDPSIVPEPLPQVELAAVTPPAPSGSCADAIAQVWPAELQAGARLVAQKESSMIADRIGPMKSDGTVGYNYNGSRDYGCFQINDQAHPQFFADGDWRDPYHNARYALSIYRSRGNWTAWYAVRGVLW